MKILFAASIYPPDPGGPATHASNFKENAEALGHEVRLVTFSRYRYLPPGIRHLAYFLALNSNVHGCDVIYAHDARSTGGPAYVVSIMTSKPLVLRVGGDVVWEKATERGTLMLSLREFYSQRKHRGLLFWGVRRVMQHAKKIIVTTPLLVETYTAHYNITGDQLIVLPNPLPSIPDTTCQNLAQPRRVGDAEEKALVFASRLVAYKNLNIVIDAFAAVYKEIIPAKLHLLGKGPEEAKLRAQVKRLGLGEHIVFGYGSRCKIDELLASAWGTIAPALTEFNPNYVLEGLALGKPFLLSREHGLPFAVPKQLLFDPANSKELEGRLRWFFSETGYREAKELIEKILPQSSYDDCSFGLPSWEANIKAQLSVLKAVAQL